MKRISDILLRSDVTLSTFMLGVGLVAWGAVAAWMSPADLIFFADASKSTTWLFWLFNYLGAGLGFVLIAWHRFPPLPSLLVCAYAVIMWSWIAAMRSASNLTAGTVLNWIVICMAALILIRTNVK